jgi:hypothetical protein
VEVLCDSLNPKWVALLELVRDVAHIPNPFSRGLANLFHIPAQSTTPSSVLDTITMLQLRIYRVAVMNAKQREPTR